MPEFTLLVKVTSLFPLRYESGISLNVQEIVSPETFQLKIAVKVTFIRMETI